MFNILAHADAANAAVASVNINWLAIVLATAAAMAIGSIWYGPLFGKRWMKLVNLKEKDTKTGWQVPMLTMTVMAFVQAFILRHFIVYTSYFYPDMSELSIGLVTALWAFVGFVLPVVLSANMFARRPNDLTQIELGNQIVTLLAIGAILGVMS